MVIYFVATAMHPFWCYYFVIDLHKGLVGIAIAGIVTNAFNFIVLAVLFIFDRELDDAKTLPDSRIFTDLKTFFT